MSGAAVLEPWNRESAPQSPLILIANHSSWWDAMLPIHLSFNRYDFDAYGMMEERQLKRFGFFRKVGMFSVDRGDGRGALESIDYAADLIRGTGRALWLFPQGEIVPNDRRPIAFGSGTARLLAAVGSASVAPVAFRYEVIEGERPSVFIRVGAVQSYSVPRETPVHIITAMLQGALTETVDRLRDDVVGGSLEEYRMVLRGRRSIDVWWDGVRG